MQGTLMGLGSWLPGVAADDAKADLGATLVHVGMVNGRQELNLHRIG